MIRRIATSLFVVAVLVAVACIDMSAPKGPASISSLLLPSPSVVVGDTMRDSVGKAAPLRVIAYDANDVPISGADVQFFVTDSAAVAHIDKGIVIGDKQGAIHVIGQVGGVQTTPVTVPVTVAPKTFALAGKIDTLFAILVGLRDTTSASTGSAKIAVTLKGVADTVSVGFVVKYDLTSAPATIAGSTVAAVSLVDEASKPAKSDTTDASGASRTLFVRSWLLADQLLQGGQKVDSAVVIVSTSYKGQPVSGSPIRVVVPIKGKIPLP